MNIRNNLILAALVLTQCVIAQQDCVSSNAPSGEIWNEKVKPMYSKNWGVEYFDTYKVVRNLASNVSYLLYQCGSKPPSTATKANYNGVYKIPVESVGITETPMLTYLEQLGLRDKIKAFLTDPAYIASPCFRDLVDSGRIATLADPQDMNSTKLNVSDSNNVSLNDLIVFDNAYGTIPFPNRVIVTEYEETTNKAYFEWVKYISVFFNAEKTANLVAAKAQERYNCIAENAATATDDKTKPIVLWGYYSSYCDGWDAGTCDEKGDLGNYYCEYAKSCGATMLSASNESGSLNVCGVTYMSTKEFVAFGKNADYWFYNSDNWNDTYKEFKNSLDQMKSVKNKKVYDYQGSGQDAWFEERIAEYYHVLQDFCHVLGRSTGLATRNWWRNVFTEKVGHRLDKCTPTTASDILNDNYVCKPGGNGSKYTSAVSKKTFSFVSIIAIATTYLSIL